MSIVIRTVFASTVLQLAFLSVGCGGPSEIPMETNPDTTEMEVVDTVESALRSEADTASLCGPGFHFVRAFQVSQDIFSGPNKSQGKLSVFRNGNRFCAVTDSFKDDVRRLMQASICKLKPGGQDARDCEGGDQDEGDFLDYAGPVYVSAFSSCVFAGGRIGNYHGYGKAFCF